MGEILATTFPGLGLQITTRPVRIRNVSGAFRAAGNVLQFLATNPNNFQTNWSQGDENSAYVLCSGPAPLASNSDGHGWACVLAEPINNGADGLAWLWHPDVDVLVAGTCAIGDPLGLTPTNGGVSLDPTPIAASRVAGIAHAARVGAGNVRALFMGVLGPGKGAP